MTDDFDMYYEKWEKYDPEATQYISLEKLSDFVDYLEPPLQLQKPNYFMLVKLDIPIFHDDQHGTAIITTAALINALDISKKKVSDVRIVVNGAGASAHP